MIPPIDLREEPCPWRMKDSIQRCRNVLPEPTQTEAEKFVCMLPPDPIPSFAWENAPTPLDFNPVEKIEMRAQLFKYGPHGENQFFAWTIDGKHPIFPIPMEEHD